MDRRKFIKPIGAGSLALAVPLGKAKPHIPEVEIIHLDISYDTLLRSPISPPPYYTFTLYKENGDKLIVPSIADHSQAKRLLHECIETFAKPHFLDKEVKDVFGYKRTPRKPVKKIYGYVCKSKIPFIDHIRMEEVVIGVCVSTEKLLTPLQHVQKQLAETANDPNLTIVTSFDWNFSPCVVCGKKDCEHIQKIIEEMKKDPNLTIGPSHKFDIDSGKCYICGAVECKKRMHLKIDEDFYKNKEKH